MNKKMTQAMKTLAENGLSPKDTIQKAKEALATMHKLSLMPKGEYLTLRSNLNGEEAEGIAERVLAVYNTFKTMPKTYETEAGKPKIVYLHYFIGAFDWYIIEKDMEEEEQIQAFGLVKTPDCPEGEYGYIDITSATKAGAELDLYWKPQEVKKGLN